MEEDPAAWGNSSSPKHGCTKCRYSSSGCAVCRDQPNEQPPAAAPAKRARADEPRSCPGPMKEFGDDVYMVEALLAERRVGGRRQYLVRWFNWGPEHDSWENEANIFDQPLIRAFCCCVGWNCVLLPITPCVNPDACCPRGPFVYPRRQRTELDLGSDA